MLAASSVRDNPLQVPDVVPALRGVQSPLNGSLRTRALFGRQNGTRTTTFCDLDIETTPHSIPCDMIPRRSAASSLELAALVPVVTLPLKL